jgi:hypothetical protein
LVSCLANLWSRNWRQHVPLKRQLSFNRLCSIVILNVHCFKNLFILLSQLSFVFKEDNSQEVSPPQFCISSLPLPSQPHAQSNLLGFTRWHVWISSLLCNFLAFSLIS